MDILFGSLVLASFVGATPRWWFRAVILALASLFVHTSAVFVVVNTQDVQAPFVDIQFASGPPVTLVATILRTNITDGRNGTTAELKSVEHQLEEDASTSEGALTKAYDLQ